MQSTEWATAVKRVSLVDSIYETLVDAIVAGRFRPGEELNSVELSRQLDVSRTPLREALRLLERDGLVHQTGHHKARVTRFTPADIREIYEVRLQLEATSAERAATRISDERLAALRAEADELARQVDAVDWREKAIAYDLRCHAAIAEAADNRRLLQEIQRYRLLVRSFCVLSGQSATLKQALAEHILILDALATRRPLRARKAMAAHIESRLKDVLKTLADTDTD